MNRTIWQSTVPKQIGKTMKSATDRETQRPNGSESA